MEHSYGHDRRRGAAASGRADELGPLTWRKSAASNPNGDCVELARAAHG